MRNLSLTPFAALVALAAPFIPDTTLAEEREYKAASYQWHPERSPQGPILVLVSLGQQHAYVYRNGVRIGQCEVSTGKAGHRSPTGVFHILNKDKNHHSKTYNNAPMPYSERLTWGGVALHAGGLPGYPSSHGCIHLPYEFSKLLFGVTKSGDTVVITNDETEPFVSKGHAAPVTTQVSEIFGAKPKWTLDAAKVPAGPVSIVVSEEDKRAYVMRNGEPIGESEVAFTRNGAVSGTQAFTLHAAGEGAATDQAGWGRVGGNKEAHDLKMEDLLRFPQPFAEALAPLLEVGDTVIITSEGVTEHTRSDPNFTILASEAARDEAKKTPAES